MERNREFTDKFVPTYFDPSTYFSSDSDIPPIVTGDNFWIKYGRGNRKTYAEGYSGTALVDGPYYALPLTGSSFDVSEGSSEISCVGGNLRSEIMPGQLILIDKSQREVFCVESVESDDVFIATTVALQSLSGAYAYGLGVIYPVGTKRGVSHRGKVIQFPSGHLIGVGDGDLALNGSTTLGSGGTFSLSDLPAFALYDSVTDTYSTDDVGIDSPGPFTLSAISQLTINAASNASPIVIGTTAAHGLTTGDRVPIAQVQGNTAANGTWIVTVLTGTTFSLDGSTGNGAYTTGGYVFPSQMRAGSYNIRLCSLSSTTKGYSQPTDVIAPITLTVNQSIRITLSSAMHDDQDSYAIYGTQFEDNATTTIEARFQGPWFKIAEVKDEDMTDGTHTTGREAGAYLIVSYADAEIGLASGLLSFDNFPPVRASFVDLLNGIPIYFSCLGKGSTTSKSRNPGPCAVPAKPSNPEAVFLRKAFTTAGGETIIGQYNAKSRLFVLCENSLQQIILTTVDEEPIAFRSLWNSGFRNPYNLALFKDYLYGFTTNGITRSVAGGDSLSTELEFAIDVADYVKDWDCGKVVVGFCPKNKAMCFFHPFYDKDNSKYYTICLPFFPEKGVWNPPIKISPETANDFIVTSCATIGNSLYLQAGGYDQSSTYSTSTYEFDGGDPMIKTAFLGFSFRNQGTSSILKRLKDFQATYWSRDSGMSFHCFFVGPGTGNPFLSREDYNSSAPTDINITLSSAYDLSVLHENGINSDPLSFYGILVSFQYTEFLPQFHELELQGEFNNSVSY